MATQKAILVSEIGKPVHLSTRLIPTPNPDEILIKVSSVQLLPHDTYARDTGLFIKPNLPYVLGINISGTIHTLGTSISPAQFPLGARIFGEGSAVSPIPDSAGLQEFATLRATDAALIPAGFSDDEVATLPTNAVTAFAALFGKGNFAIPFPGDENKDKDFDYAAQTLVIIGGGSNVGRLTVQFAKMVGIGRIIAIASLRGEEELKKLGATHVIDRYSKDIPSEVYAAAGGKDAVTRVMDCVNWTYELAAELVSGTRPGGRIATLHMPETVIAELERLGKGENVKAGVAMGLREHFGDLAELFWGNVGEWLEKGVIKPGKFRVIEGLDVERINEALDSYRDGKPVTQAIVHPNE